MSDQPRKRGQHRTPAERATHELQVAEARMIAAKAANKAAIEAALAAGTLKDQAAVAYELSVRELEHARKHPALPKDAS